MSKLYKHLIQRYREGNLKEAEQAKLEAAIAEGELSLEEIAPFNEWMGLPVTHPDSDSLDTLDQRFYVFLDQEKQKQQSKQKRNLWMRHSIKWAAAVLVLFLTFVGGSRWHGKQTSLYPDSEHLLAQSILETEDVNEKIHLVSTTEIKDDSDIRIIDALLLTLIRDESRNVRLACIHTLMAYSHLPRVREGLIRAISFQESTIVLLTLAEAIEASGRRITYSEFRAHLNKDLSNRTHDRLEQVLTQ